MTPKEHADKVIKVLDSEATNLRGEEYREFLEEVYSDVESKLTCFDFSFSLTPRIAKRGSTCGSDGPFRAIVIEGTLPEDDLRRAFVNGARWWEYHSTGGTMWQSDGNTAEQEAEKRYPNGKLPEKAVD